MSARRGPDRPPEIQERARVEQLIAGLPGTPPRREQELSFDAPWEVRALGMAVELHEQGVFPWPEFQAGLVAAIREWEDTSPAERGEWSYYRHWAQALEHLLDSKGLLDPAEVEARTQEILCAKPAAGHRA